MGPFIEAWLRVHGDTRGIKDEARKQFLTPLLHRLDPVGLAICLKSPTGTLRTLRAAAPFRPGQSAKRCA